MTLSLEPHGLWANRWRDGEGEWQEWECVCGHKYGNADDLELRDVKRLHRQHLLEVVGLTKEHKE